MSAQHYTTVEVHPASCPSQRYSAILVHGGQVIERMSFRTLAEAERQADFSRFGIEYRPPAVPPARGGFDRLAVHADPDHAGDAEVSMPGLLEEEEPAAAEEPQESGQVSGERHLKSVTVDPHTGIGRLPKVGRDYSSSETAAPRFCGFLVVDLDGYSEDGLPNSLIGRNGEHLPLRPRNRQPFSDAWYSPRLGDGQYGDWALNFTREQLVEIRNGGFALARETSALSMAGAWRKSSLGGLRRQAIEAGCCEKRWDKAVDIISYGGLEEARQKYGSSPSSCSCPDAQSGRSRACKHRIAWTIAEKLQWDPTVVYDAAKWIAPEEMLSKEKGEELAGQVRRERSRLPESMTGYNPGVSGELVAQAVPA